MSNERNIDWNKWYKPLKESLQAFCIDDAVLVAEKFGLQWHTSEEDPVCASSIHSVLTDMCEDLIDKLESNWEYQFGEEMEYNTYKDDAGILTSEVTVYTQDDSLLHPKFIVKLRNDKGYYFEIFMVIADQMF